MADDMNDAAPAELADRAAQDPSDREAWHAPRVRRIGLSGARASGEVDSDGITFS
ncbi:hypothetical protein [Zavarzinia sp. CC-PAN008]|uniref:hypothetical protein n=1 Tax=Zavarzinia sp. CC-PAN008 TaxID=3243332 RepID=UPI003F749A8F